MCCSLLFFCFKQKTAYEMRISDWSSDVCSSDLDGVVTHLPAEAREVFDVSGAGDTVVSTLAAALGAGLPLVDAAGFANAAAGLVVGKVGTAVVYRDELAAKLRERKRSEEHTSELQSLMRISYAVFCLKKKNNKKTT